MEDSDEWTDVAVETPLEYLVSSGLLDFEANSVVEVAGITSMKDFSLLDDSMLLEVAKEAGLKLIPAKKLSKAVKALFQTKDDPNMKQEEKKDDPNAKQEAKPTTTPTPTSEEGNIRPDECVVISIDRSGSMGCGFDEAKAFGPNAEKTLTKRSRMDAVKQCFYAFRDRTETLDTRHFLGLIQFDDRVEQMLPLTADLDRFESVVDDMRPRASTAIYASILQSCRMLAPHNNPKTELRVLVLTDGQNNAGVTPQDALKEVQKIGAVVDAILVGDTPDENLCKIVAASGGTCFQVRSLSEGFELMEAESVVSLRSRRGGGDRPAIKPVATVDFSTIQTQTITRASQAARVSTVPARATGGPLKLVRANAIQSNPWKGTLRRITKELMDFSKESNEEDGIRLYTDENNPFQQKALLDGPSGTVFEGGVFLVDIALPANYPFKPPKIRFETPVFHCNVSSNGGTCLDILADQWSPALTVPKCLKSFQSLLSDPNTDYALRPSIAELYFAHRKSGGADQRYTEQAKAATLQDASRTVEEWETVWSIGKP